jgi:hypothetical protein
MSAHEYDPNAVAEAARNEPTAAEHLVLRLRAEIERRDDEHEMAEPYPGAGYCGCHSCQVLVPLLLDCVAEVLRSSIREGAA